MADEQEESVPINNVTDLLPLPPISDHDLTTLSLKEINKLLKGRSDEQELRDKRAMLKRKQSSIKTRSKQKEAMKEYEEKRQRIAASKPKDWKQLSVKHRKKFERLLNLWDNVTLISGYGVIFEKEFLIGSGSYGTEVYICLGSDGIERAIKRLPKQLCTKLLKNERNILNCTNAVKSPQIVNYCFYDDTSSSDFGYLILNLYEQNLEEFIKEKGETMTESYLREMIRQVLEGLKALHTRDPRILHRDLKPTNVLVDVRGGLALSDFGIGRVLPEG
ncbi:serine threonine- kinase ppk4-like, partial [Paramuricea clavata]